ncbi:MAG: hypothetical protein K2X01_04130 [Cyanobacteria bacterium]|nr:hypothetical protein [Cyanobacteriota bacterium]
MNVSHSNPSKFAQSGFHKASQPKFSATSPLTSPKFSAASATSSGAEFNGLNGSMKEVLSKLEELLKPFKPFLDKIKNNPLLLLIGGLLAVFGFNGLQGKTAEAATAETSEVASA